MTHRIRRYRYQTHIPVQINRPGGPQVAYVIDVNEGGACVTGLSGVSRGDAIVLRGLNKTNVATVRWAANSRMGVSFERQMTPQQLSLMRFSDPIHPRRSPQELDLNIRETLPN